MLSMLCGVICAAWAGHTDRSRAWAEDIRQAFAEFGIKHEEAARTMGLTPQDLSAQLAGRDPLNLYRLTHIGPEFEDVLLNIRSKRSGAVFVNPHQVKLLQGAAALWLKHSVTLPLGQKESAA